MQQKRYQGTLNSTDLADYLVYHFTNHLQRQTQKVGEVGAYIVQIGLENRSDRICDAISITITSASEQGPGLTVTIGEQPWITTQMARSAAFWTLLSLLVTPWALLFLLAPIRQAITTITLPNEIWQQVEERVLKHPHED